MRNAVVVDTSLAIKWILEEPDSDKADILLVEWSKKRKEILVPALLIYEIANAPSRTCAMVKSHLKGLRKH